MTDRLGKSLDMKFTRFYFLAIFFFSHFLCFSGIQESWTSVWISWCKSCQALRRELLYGILVFSLSLDPLPWTHPLPQLFWHLELILSLANNSFHVGSQAPCGFVYNPPQCPVPPLLTACDTGTCCHCQLQEREFQKVRPVEHEVLFLPQIQV